EVDFWQEAATQAVDQPQNDRTQQCTWETAQATNHDNNEAFNNDFVAHARVNGPHGRSHDTTKRCQPSAKGEHTSDHQTRVDAEHLSHVPIDRRCTHDLAGSRLVEQEPQPKQHNSTSEYDEQAVNRITDSPRQGHGAPQQFRRFHHVNACAPNHAHGLIQDEQQGEREQQTVSDFTLVHEAQHQPVNQDSEHGYAQRRNEQRRPERHAQPIDTTERQVRPQHIERTMREIDDVENAEDNIQAHGDDEQQKANIQTIEQGKTETAHDALQSA